MRACKNSCAPEISRRYAHDYAPSKNPEKPAGNVYLDGCDISYFCLLLSAVFWLYLKSGGSQEIHYPCDSIQWVEELKISYIFKKVLRQY